MTVIDELATVLFGLEARAESTAAMTARITRTITQWAHGRGWTARTEARVGVAEAGSEAVGPRLGYVDVVVRRNGEGPDLAIEIDSADKPWSVEKLRHAAVAGMQPVWVRWGDETWAGGYRDVDVIQLPLLRRPSTGPGGRQLALWTPQR